MTDPVVPTTAQPTPVIPTGAQRSVGISAPRSPDTTPTARPLPRGWRWARLGDVCPLQYGSGLAEAKRQPGNVPVYGSNGIIGYHSRSLTKGPTILVGRKGSVGAVHFSESPCWPIDTTYFIEHTEPECDLQWLTYTLCALDLPGLRESTGVPGLDRNDAHELQIPLPPLTEQRHIAAVLREALDAVRRAREAAVARLEAARALPAAFLRSVFESEEAQSWPLRPFGDLVNNFDGRRIPLKLEDRRGCQGPHPYYGASGVIDHIDDYLFDGEYLLIGEDGANLLLRATPIAFKASGQFWVNNHAHVVQPNELARADFLVHFLATMDLRPFVTGSAQPKLTQADLNRIPVPTPGLEVQDGLLTALLRQMDASDRAIAVAEAELATTDALPQSLLRQAFSGEL